MVREGRKRAADYPQVITDIHIEGKFPREEIIVRSEEASMLMGRWHWDLPPPHCASCLTTPLVSDKERLRRWGRM